MSNKIIYTGLPALKKVLNGVQTASSVVARSYGPLGRTGAWNAGNNMKVTKDGISLLKAIALKDEAEDMGVKIVTESSGKANFHSGDGSTTTAILTGALCSAAYSQLSSRININDVRAGFKAAQEDVLKNLNEYKYEVENDEDLKRIAKVSANGDEEIADFITQAFVGVGDDGIISIMDALNREGKTSLEFTTGFEIPMGYRATSSRCIMEQGQDVCVQHKPRVFVFREPMNDPKKFEEIFALLSMGEKQPTIIFAPFFDDDIKTFHHNVMERKPFSLALIPMPGSSQDIITHWIEDTAILTGAKIIGEGPDDKNIDEFNLSWAGSAATVKVYRDKTEIVEPTSNEEELTKYVENIKNKLNDESNARAYSVNEREDLTRRVAALTGGIATIYIGGRTSTELDEKKDRYEDALNAVRAVLKQGYVIGAGSTLLKSSYKKRTLESAAQQSAYDAYMRAIRVPAKLLIESAGKEFDVIAPEVLKEKDFGFNAREMKVVDLKKAGIIDPAFILENAVIYATTSAETFMSLDVIMISEERNLSFTPKDEQNDDREIFNFK